MPPLNLPALIREGAFLKRGGVFFIRYHYKMSTPEQLPYGLNEVVYPLVIYRSVTHKQWASKCDSYQVLIYHFIHTGICVGWGVLKEREVLNSVNVKKSRALSLNPLIPFPPTPPTSWVSLKLWSTISKTKQPLWIPSKVPVLSSTYRQPRQWGNKYLYQRLLMKDGWFWIIFAFTTQHWNGHDSPLGPSHRLYK